MKSLRVRPARSLVSAALLTTAAALLLSGCAKSPDATTEPGAETDSRAPERLSGVTRTPQPDVGQVVMPDVSPTVAGGAAVSFRTKADAGDLLLVFFGYTSCPDICPATLSHLKTARRDLGPLAERVSVAMVTVDPQRDTPAVLDAYLAHFFTDYHALRTEDPATLDAAKVAFGASSEITPEPDGTYSVAHSAGIYAVDPHGKIVVEWPFGTNGEQMATDMKILLGRLDAEPGTG